MSNSESTHDADQPDLARGRLAALVESSSDAILSLTLDGVITTANKGAQRLYGYSQQELVGNSVSMLFPQERRDEFKSARERLERGESVAAFDTVRLRKDGTSVHVSVNLSPIKDGATRVVGVSHVARDITERKHTEAALRESEQRMRAILETAVEGIITIDERGLIESINPAACRIFGYEPNDVIGRNVNVLMPSPDRERHDGYLANYAQTGHAKIIGTGREVVGQRKNGTTFPMDLSVCELRLGERRLFTGFVRDISQRRELEQAVEAAGEQERARIARELHDGLGQQLGGLLFLMDGLRRDLRQAHVPQADTAEQLGKELSTALKQARNLAHELYSVSPTAEGLVEALESLAERVSERGVTCQFHSEPRVLINHATAASHLYRLAQEAVHNALKHSAATRIDIELTRSSEAVELSVRDNGKGLMSQPGSPGLGLRTMEQRARLMNGHVKVHTQRDGGVEVICSVPTSVVDRARSG